MLPALRDARGKPAAPLRLLAVLIVLGMLTLAAPVLVPLLRWASGAPRIRMDAPNDADRSRSI